MALYHKIAEFIMEKIKTEEWKKGQLIPSEKEFCEQFQVSRPTVRAAIAYLANQGYLVTVKGKGTFVSETKDCGGYHGIFGELQQGNGNKGYLCADGSIRTADDCGR